MSKDKAVEILVEVLKQALAEPGEQRLYRSGKLDGLFASRSGLNAEAAARAIREELLEVVRTETKGKLTVEWVRLTPAGVDFVHEQESPRRALEDLHAILQVNRERLPLWLGEMQAQLQNLSQQLADETQRWSHRLGVLSDQVEATLKRGEQATVLDNDVPWASEAIAYMERRQATGGAEACPLPELFAAVREHCGELSVTAFHDGLRRLYDAKRVKLLPFAGNVSELPEPEYALLNGTAMWYYASRPI